jgi:hypothetical protein
MTGADDLDRVRAALADLRAAAEALGFRASVSFHGLAHPDALAALPEGKPIVSCHGKIGWHRVAIWRDLEPGVGFAASRDATAEEAAALAEHAHGCPLAHCVKPKP